MSKIITIDGSKLLPYMGTIYPGLVLELSLIKLYKSRLIGNEISEFTNLLLKKIYIDNKDRAYSNINNFYTDKDYLNRIYRIWDILHVIILRNIPPDFISFMVIDVKRSKNKLYIYLNVEGSMYE